MRHLYLFGLVILLAVCQQSLAGPRRGGARGKRQKCMYDISRGDCDPTTKKMTITKTPKAGQPESCQTKTMEKNCNTGKRVKCQFEKPTFSPCTDGQRTVTRQPVEGSDPSCQPKTRTRACRGAGKKNVCKFGPWGDFSACVDGVKTKTRPILSGEQAACAAKSTKTKSCQN